MIGEDRVTEIFNNDRASKWAKQLTKEKSRLFLMAGMKKDHSFFLTFDKTLTPKLLAEKLEELAKAIRLKIFTSEN